MALEIKDWHIEGKRLYLEYKNVKKALLWHIQDAIEDKYIESLVDEHTNLLIGDVLAILKYLSYNYEKVRSKEITQKDNNIMIIT